MKKFSYLFLLLLLISCKSTQKEKAIIHTSSNKHHFTWQQVGPSLPNKDLLDKYSDATQTYWHGEGRISSIWKDDKNDNHLLIGVGFGGLFETFDAGENWKSITNTIPVNEISNIKVKDQTIFISAGYRFNNPLRFSTVRSRYYGLGVVKSKDGGKTWHLPKTKFYGADFSLSNQHQTIYAISTKKIYKSIDHGDSFNQIADFTIETTSKINHRVELGNVIVHPTNPNIAYVSGKRANHKNAKILLKTIDGGKNWTNELPKLNQFIKNKPTKSYGHYIKDVALHFNEKTNKFWVHFSVAFQFKTANKREYKKIHSVIINSTDFNHFDFIMSQEIIGGTHYAPNFYEKDDTFYLLAWYLHIKKPNEKKFVNVGTGKVHQDCRAVAIDSKGKIYYGNDAGIVKSTDHGQTWTNAYTNLNANLVYEMSYYSDKTTRRIAFGTQDTGYYLNNLDGLPNYPIETHEGGIYISKHQKDRIYVKDNTVKKSINGGKKFSTLKINSGKPVVTMHRDGMLVEDPIDANVLYVGHYSEVYVSNNFGEKDSWKNISPKGKNKGRSSDLAISKANNNILYLANQYIFKNKKTLKYDIQSHLMKSVNKGKTWSNITTQLNKLLVESIISDVEVDDKNPDQVWITLRNFEAGKKIFYSKNGGKTWTNISYNLPNVPANRIEYNQKSKSLILANDYGVYFLEKNTWKEYGENLPKVIITSIALDYHFNELIVSTFGRGIWRVKLK